MTKEERRGEGEEVDRSRGWKREEDKGLKHYEQVFLALEKLS